jgi:hypothetical protein
LLKSEFESYRNDDKKRYEDIESFLDVNENQMPDHPNILVIWNRSFELFKVFRNNVEDHHG